MSLSESPARHNPHQGHPEHTTWDTSATHRPHIGYSSNSITSSNRTSSPSRSTPEHVLWNFNFQSHFPICVVFPISREPLCVEIRRRNTLNGSIARPLASPAVSPPWSLISWAQVELCKSSFENVQLHFTLSTTPLWQRVPAPGGRHRTSLGGDCAQSQCPFWSSVPCFKWLQVASRGFKWLQGKNWPLLEMQEPSGMPGTLGKGWVTWYLELWKMPPWLW